MSQFTFFLFKINHWSFNEKSRLHIMLWYFHKRFHRTVNFFHGNSFQCPVETSPYKIAKEMWNPGVRLKTESKVENLTKLRTVIGYCLTWPNGPFTVVKSMHSDLRVPFEIRTKSYCTVDWHKMWIKMAKFESNNKWQSAYVTIYRF